MLAKNCGGCYCFSSYFSRGLSVTLSPGELSCIYFRLVLGAWGSLPLTQLSVIAIKDILRGVCGQSNQICELDLHFIKSELHCISNLVEDANVLKVPMKRSSISDQPFEVIFYIIGSKHVVYVQLHCHLNSIDKFSMGLSTGWYGARKTHRWPAA